MTADIEVAEHELDTYEESALSTANAEMEVGA
jgi:hypothetical protein